MGNSHYQNFKNPGGLAIRLLRHPNPAARALLVRAAARIALTPLDIARAGRQQRLLSTAPPSERPIVLVTGGARTGTSLTAQVLARRLDVSWFDNWADLFPRSGLIAGARRGNDPSQVSLTSVYGNTHRLGDLSDAFSVWNEFLGADRYQPHLDPDTADALRSYFDAAATVFPKPLLNKNNRNLRIVTELAAALPQARFVLVTREPLPTVASLLEARRMVHGDVRQPWGVYSTVSAAPDDELGYIDDVCAQVIASDRACRSAGAFLGHRATVVDFEKVLADPDLTAELISGELGVGARPDAPPIDLTPPDGRRPSMTRAERERARRVLSAAGLE